MRSNRKTVLVVFAAVLALSAATASSAFAAKEWGTITPAWGQGGALLKESVATKWKGSMRLTDAGYEGSSGPTFECEEDAEGSVGPESVGKVTSWPMSKCVVVRAGACEVLEEIGAVHLPWHSELSVSKIGTGTVMRNKMTQEGKGAPGFEFKCKATFGTFVDTCTETTVSTTAENIATGVEANLANEIPLNCTIGGKGKGTVEGEQKIEASSGGKLEVRSGAFKKLTSALAVTATGKIRVEDTGYVGGGGAECPIETEGTLEAGGLGKISYYHSTGPCVAVGGCGSVKEVLTLYLPWKTELFEAGSAIDNKLLSGGSGAPQWQFDCSNYPYEKITCTLPASLLITNNSSEGDVEETFTGEPRTVCSPPGEANTAKWTGVLKIGHPENVEAIKAQ